MLITCISSEPFHFLRGINFKFLQPNQPNITSHCMENLTFHSLLRWKMIILPILTTLLVHFFLKGWENVLWNLLSSKSTFSQPFKRRLYEWCRENLYLSLFIWVSYEKPSSPYCVMSYFLWGCRGILTLITLRSERVNSGPSVGLPGRDTHLLQISWPGPNVGNAAVL